MIRLILFDNDHGAAATVGGPVNVTFKSFDLDLPELEAWLKEKPDSYVQRGFLGAEIVEAKQG